MPLSKPHPSPFGQELRLWRRRRGLSQLELSVLAETTPRHVSFIETGRSRPGRDLVLRMSECMDLPIRSRNALLTSVGLPAAFAERDLDDEELQPFRMAVAAILERHDPYPARAIDALGKVQMTNRADRLLWRGNKEEDMTPEQSLDAFFEPSPYREVIENWEDVAWKYVDRLRHVAERTNHPRMAALVKRGMQHLKGIDRLRATEKNSPVMCQRLKIGEQIIPVFLTIMRFENPHEITISELRVELIFPMDSAGDAFFRELAASSD